MAGNVAFVDAEGLVRAYLNTLTGTLVGVGKPLPLGVHLNRLRSPQAGPYGLLTRVGGYDDPGEGNLDFARLSVAVYASTKQAAATAAVAVANTFRALDGAPVAVAGFGVIGATQSISGPLYQPDADEDRYIVDVVIALHP